MPKTGATHPAEGGATVYPAALIAMILAVKIILAVG